MSLAAIGIELQFAIVIAIVFEIRLLKNGSIWRVLDAKFNKSCKMTKKERRKKSKGWFIVYLFLMLKISSNITNSY